MPGRYTIPEIYNFITATDTFLQTIAFLAAIVAVALVFARTKSTIPTVTTAVFASFAVWAVNNGEFLRRLAEEEVGGPLRNITPAQGETLTARIVPVAQYFSILIGILITTAVFAKTKSAVSTVIVGLLAGFVVWFAFNVALAAENVGKEVAPGSSGRIHVPRIRVPL